MIDMTTQVGGRFVAPDIVATHFHLHAGDTVADFGAGSGFFVPALAAAVGEEGQVYACEIQKPLVEKIGDTARAQALSAVHPLWCDIEESGGIKIADNELDAAILVNTLFQVEDIETALAEMIRTLRSGGKFFIVDWSESFAGMGPQPDQVVRKADVTALCESLGLILEREFPAGEHHYGLAFRKV